VSNFIALNQDSIKQTVIDSQLDASKKIEAARYLKYLVLHVKRLCKYAPDQVAKVVARTYYPEEECIKICEQKRN